MPKWRDVTPGATVLLKGNEWRVEKIKLKGKVVKVTVKGTAGEFTRELDAKGKVELVAAGWATKAQADAADRLQARSEATHKPPRLPKAKMAEAKRELAKEPPAAERTVRKYLDAKLLAVEVDGVYVMPHPNPSTIAAHLLAFHGVTATGATLAEAKQLARTHSPESAVELLSWAKLKAAHDEAHSKIESGAIAALVPHLHTNERQES